MDLPNRHVLMSLPVDMQDYLAGDSYTLKSKSSEDFTELAPSKRANERIPTHLGQAVNCAIQESPHLVRVMPMCATPRETVTRATQSVMLIVR